MEDQIGDDKSKNLRQVIIIAEFLSRFTEHLDTLLEGDSRHFAGFRELEGLDVVDASDELGFLAVAGVELLEDEEHEIFQDAHDFVVVFLELHFQIEAGELGQVTRGVGVLSTEDGADFHDLLEA